MTLLDEGKETSSGSYIYTAEIPGFKYNIKLYTNISLDCDPYDKINGNFKFSESDEKYSDYNRSENVIITAFIKGDDYKIIKTEIKPVFSVLFDLRKGISNILERSMGESAALAKALLIGDKSDLSPSDNKAITNSGLSHIVAVSGFHVGVMAAIIVFFLGFIKNKYIKTIILLLSLFFLLGLFSFTPSAVRAIIMAAIAFSGGFFDERTDTLSNLGFAVCLMLFINPFSIVSASFILSVSATFAIIILHPYLYSWLVSLIFVKSSYKVKGVIKYLLEIFSITASCLVFTFPFMLYFFGKAPIIAILSNLICLPLSTAALCGCIIVTVLGFIPFCSVLALFVGKIVSFGVDLFMSLAYFFSEIDFASLKFEPVTVIVSALIGFTVYLLFRRKDKKKSKEKKYFRRSFFAILTSIIILFAGALINLYIEKHSAIIPEDKISLAFIDVGQGSGTTIISGHKAIIIDCGGTNKPGETMTKYLNERGVDEIEFVILSHLHDDHVNGFDELCEAFNIKEIIIPYTEGDASIYLEVIDLAEKEGAELTILEEDNSLDFKGVSIKLLTKHFIETASDQNENSIVCITKFGNFSSMLTGDITSEAEKRLLENYTINELRVSVLGVPHHGSRYSSCTEFLAAVRPEYSIISVGKNSYGHPANEVIERLEKYGVIISTQINGTVEFITDGTGAEVIREK